MNEGDEAMVKFFRLRLELTARFLIICPRATLITSSTMTLTRGSKILQSLGSTLLLLNRLRLLQRKMDLKSYILQGCWAIYCYYAGSLTVFLRLLKHFSWAICGG